MRKIFLFTIAAAVLIQCFSSPAQARIWDDLREEDREFFGSEKFEKYPVNAFVVEKEKWKDHESFKVFWFYKHTDYPRYSSTRVFPFWYSLDSKIDNRSLTFFLFFYGERDGNERFRINPLFFDSKINDRKESSYSRTNGSLFHYYTFEKLDGRAETTWWAPIVPLVYRHTTGTGGHQNILWLIDYAWERSEGRSSMTRFWFAPILFHAPGDDGYTALLPPVFVWNRHQDGRRWVHLLPLFADSKNINAGEEGENIYSHSTISIPYGWQSDRKSGWDGEKTLLRLWFPLIPIVYWYSDYGHEYHRNIAWAIDWHENKDEKIDRFWLAPFWFWKQKSYKMFLPPVVFMKVKGDDGWTTLVLPPVFVYREHSNGERWNHLFPFYFLSYSKDIQDGNTVYETRSASILHGYQSKELGRWDGKQIESRIWFPLLPLYYSYDKPGVESHTNVAGVFDWHRGNDESVDRFWAAPVFFWKKDRYLHILPPLFVHTEEEKESMTFFAPFYVRAEGNNTEKERAAEKTFWAPVIPLYYSYENPGVESHTNLAWIFDWHRRSDESIDRFWASPVWFWKEKSYLHILPPLYMSFQNNGYRYDHLLPLGLRVQEKTEAADDDAVYTVLGGYHSIHEAGSGEMQHRSWWFPVIPLLYHSFDKDEGTHTNLLWVMNWSHGTDGELKNFNLFPFIRHDSSEGGTRFYGLYLRPSGWTESEGYSISPLHYHRWSSSEDLLWSALIHYRHDNEETKEHTNLWAPLWYTKETKSYELSSKFLLYFHYDNPGEKYASRIAAPFYWSFDTPKRDTSVVFPLYLSTQRKDGSGKFHLNILGITSSFLAGTNPLASFGAGLNERGIYLDSDVSWLYNMFSLEMRNTLPLSQTRFASMLPESMKTEPEKKAAEPALSTRSSLDREDSISYFGWSVLYGLLAYKHADTKHHFRLLPLSYLTWDDATDNRVNFVFASYLSYRDKESSYFVLMPLFVPVYGSQTIGQSHKEGYALIAYWNEYDDTEKRTEKSFLWPLVNVYYAPDRSGWRALLPLPTWHKYRAENGAEKRQTFTVPLFYHSSSYAADGTKLSSFMLTPLSYYSYSHSGNQEHTSWNPTLPLFGYRNTVETVTLQEKVKNADAVRKETRSESTTGWFFPFFYYQDSTVSGNGAAQNENERFYAVLPLFGGYSTRNGSAIDDWFAAFPAFLPVYVAHQRDESYFRAYGLIACWSEYDAQTKEKQLSILWPIFNRYESPEESGWRIFPFLWRKQRQETITNHDLSDKTEKNSAVSENRSSSWLAVPFFYTREDSSKDLKTGKTMTETTQFGLPLFYRHIISLSDSSRPGEETEDETLFFMGALKKSTSSGPSSTNVLAGLYSSENNGADWTRRWLWFLGSASQQGKDYTCYFHPLWYYDNDDGRRSFFLLFGLFHRMTDPGMNETNTSGLWWIVNDSTSRGQIYSRGKFRPTDDHTFWFFPFFVRNNETTIDNGEETWSTTWWAPVIPLLYHHSENGYSHTNVALLFDVATDELANESHVWGMPLFWLNTGSDGYCHLLPLWLYSWDTGAKSSSSASLLHYYDRIDDGTQYQETTFWAPIIPLAYYHSSKDETHFNLAGIIDIERNDAEQSWNGWLFPLFFGKSGDDGYCLVAPPLYMSGWNDRENERWKFIFPVYHSTGRGYKRWNTLWLWDWINRPSDQYSDWSLLFRFLEVEHYRNLISMRAAWGLLADAQWSETKSDYNLNALLYLAGVSREGDRFHSRVLPLWYYESDPESHTLWVPPLLSYDNKDSDGSEHRLWLLGAAWTKWYEPKDHSDLSLVLLGIPYYGTQREEKGYEAQGSLWGLLWETESESETGFKSFSILKFVYKRVEMEGKTYTSIFGIRSESD